MGQWGGGCRRRARFACRNSWADWPSPASPSDTRIPFTSQPRLQHQPHATITQAACCRQRHLGPSSPDDRAQPAPAALAASKQSGGSMASASFGSRLNVSLQAVAQVLLVCGLGVWLARRHGFDRKGIAAVSGVNWHVLIPALMFSSIVGAVTPGNLVLLAPLLLVSLLHIVLGVVPSLLLGWAARLPRDLFFFTVMASSLPNCGNLPWLFMPTLIRYCTPPQQAAAQIAYMVGLVSVYTIVTIIVTLTVPFLLKRPPRTLLVPRSRARAASLELAPPGAHQQQQQQQQQPAAGSCSPEPADAGAAAAADQLARRGATAAAAAAAQAASPRGGGSKDVQALPPGSPCRVHAMATAAAAAASLVVAAPAVALSAAAAAPAAAAPPLKPPGIGQPLRSPAGSSSELTADDDDDDDVEAGRRPAVVQRGRHADHLQQLPAVACDSLASREPSASGMQLLQGGRQLFGSFSRSFNTSFGNSSFGRGLGRSFSRGLQRSGSLVALVWSFPRGWHRQGGDSQQQRRRWRPGGAWGRLCCCYTTRPLPRWLQRAVAAWRAVLAHPVVNLPLGATVAGIACAAVGPVRQLLVPELAPLHWLWLGLGWVGAAAAPLATMQIGAELLQPAPEQDRLHVSRRAQWAATAIAILVKLVVVPLLNVLLLRSAGLTRLVPADDAVYQLLLLVEGAVPAAVTLLVVCGRVYPDIRPLSRMLFWQYLASMVTLPAFLVWFMSLLEL